MAHVDTAPAFPGKNVKPIVHRKWNGRKIVLPDDPAQVIDPAAIPELSGKRGEDIVTASGRTLLGADDKAGVAIIMTFVAELLRRPDLRHGPIRVCFNPDEEIGQGVKKLDLKEFGAQTAYTLDGEQLGEVSWETFSADDAAVTIWGVSTHPGEGKRNKMVNAVNLAAKLLAALPRDEIDPETTEKRQGFIHPDTITGSVARVEIHFLLRDFEMAGLEDKRRRLRGLCRGLQATEPRARIACRFKPRYRNMGYWLRNDLTPVNLAIEAVRACGLTPLTPPTRGGTDGSRLAERGLPAPNLFTGAHNLHGPLEWVSAQDMEKSVQVLLELAQLWEKKGLH